MEKKFTSRSLGWTPSELAARLANGMPVNVSRDSSTSQIARSVPNYMERKSTTSDMYMDLRNLVECVHFTRQFTNSQNIGQSYNGVLKYKTVGDDGKCAGIGYVFEDLAKEEFSKNHKVKSVEPFKNGPDLIIDGKRYQLKCGKNGYTSASHCYEKPYGVCRYPDQYLVVPKGQKKIADTMVAGRMKNRLGGPLGVIESDISREDAERALWRGKDSFIMDMKIPGLIKSSVAQGMGAAAVGLTLQTIISHDDMTPGKFVKRVGGWTLGGIALSFVSLLAECSYRQDLRPTKM